MLNFYRFNHFRKYPSILHAVSQKSSELPYEFSLALHTGENTQDIIKNRHILAKELNSKTPLDYIIAQQTHGSHIENITNKETRGWQSEKNTIKDCDALITNIKGLALCILTADCVPILLYDKKQKAIAAIHAGWKGTKSRIVTKTIQKMQMHYASNPKDIIVGIGPSIGACCYEVDKNVAKYFFDIPKSIKPLKEKYLLDLALANKEQLLHAGILETNIEMSHICTACKVERFFSYRQEKKCTGRFMSIIALT